MRAHYLFSVVALGFMSCGYTKLVQYSSKGGIVEYGDGEPRKAAILTAREHCGGPVRVVESWVPEGDLRTTGRVDAYGNVSARTHHEDCNCERVKFECL